MNDNGVVFPCVVPLLSVDEESSRVGGVAVVLRAAGEELRFPADSRLQHRHPAPERGHEHPAGCGRHAGGPVRLYALVALYTCVICRAPRGLKVDFHRLSSYNKRLTG